MTVSPETLRVVPVFADLDDEALLQLSSTCKHHTFKKNTELIRQGEIGKNLYIIESGRVRVYVASEDGREITINEESGGSCIGEIALLDDEPRSASVVTLEKTEAIAISKAAFQECVTENPAIAFAIIRTLTRRLRSATGGLKSLALDNVYRRLAAKITELAVEDEDNVLRLQQRYTHQDLGNMVGASREMVSKVMAELVKGGYIELQDKKITVCRTLPRDW
jgi:CRP/FNR family cyclic AMP-dependent transcriptional regulator